MAYQKQYTHLVNSFNASYLFQQILVVLSWNVICPSLFLFFFPHSHFLQIVTTSWVNNTEPANLFLRLYPLVMGPFFPKSNHPKNNN